LFKKFLTESTSLSKKHFTTYGGKRITTPLHSENLTSSGVGLWCFISSPEWTFPLFP
jgi:hypothetical protein